MSLLDWNSIVNSRQGITFSLKGPSKFSRSRWSKFKEIRPPFPQLRNPDDLIITFDINFTTQILTRFKKSLWLKKYNPKVLTPPGEQLQAAFDTRNEVGGEAYCLGIFIKTKT